MPIRRGVLAGLALGAAISGGTLAFCATAASADDPGNNAQADAFGRIPFLPVLVTQQKQQEKEEEREEDSTELPVAQQCVNFESELQLGIEQICVPLDE
jgi:hypothetical protein